MSSGKSDINEIEQNFNTILESANAESGQFSLQFNFSILEFEYLCFKRYHKLVCTCNNSTYMSSKRLNMQLNRFLYVEKEKSFDDCMQKLLSTPSSTNKKQFCFIIKSKSNEAIVLEIENSSKPERKLEYKLSTKMINPYKQNFKLEVELLDVQRKLLKLEKRPAIGEPQISNKENPIANIMINSVNNSNAFNFLFHKIRMLETFTFFSNRSFNDINLRLNNLARGLGTTDSLADPCTQGTNRSTTQTINLADTCQEPPVYNNKF